MRSFSHNAAIFRVSACKFAVCLGNAEVGMTHKVPLFLYFLTFLHLFFSPLHLYTSNIIYIFFFLTLIHCSGLQKFAFRLWRNYFETGILK